MNSKFRSCSLITVCSLANCSSLFLLIFSNNSSFLCKRRHAKPLRKIKLLKKEFLQNLALLVKVFSLISALSLSNAYAQAADSRGEDIIFAKGEQKELVVKNLVKFSVGNSDVVTCKYFPKRSAFLLKGKNLGFSDLHYWEGKVKKSVRLYIISRKDHLQVSQLLQGLSDLALTTQLRGEFIDVSGEIATKGDYLTYKKLYNQHREKLNSQVNLNPLVKNKLLSDFYQEMYDKKIYDIECRQKTDSLLSCILPTRYLSKKEVLELNLRYGIDLEVAEKDYVNQNFKLSFKIYQLENSSGQEISWSLSTLKVPLKILWDHSLSSLLENNILSLSKTKTEIKTLAEPTMISRVGMPSNIQVGAELPYYTRGRKSGQTVQWKFAGLQLKFHLQTIQGKIFVDYENEFSRPGDEGSISGSKQKGSFYLGERKYLQIFDIGYQVDSQMKQDIPLIEKIPILNLLFSGRSNEKTYKKIIGVVYIEQMKKD